MKQANELFSNKGQRRTTQRELLLDIIYNSNSHLDALELYEQAKQHLDVSLSTVYRNLKLFKELGLIQEHQFGDFNKYYEPRTKRHHHLVCLGCGRVFEFECQTTEKLKQMINVEKGFQVVDTEVQLSGYCPECQKRNH
jgi:Fe2+ or Zn2+ uptake regulation protein